MKRNGLVAGSSLTALMFAALALPGSLRAQGSFVYTNNEAQTANVPLHALIQLDAGLAQQNVEQPAPQQNNPVGVSSAPPAGKALVYVYRQGRVLGAAGYDRIFVNDEYLAALHNSNYAQREVQPGTVVFATLPRMKVVPGVILEAELMKLRKKAKERLRMEVEEGKTYYVKWSIGGKMKLMDAATGAKEMSAFHPAKD